MLEGALPGATSLPPPSSLARLQPLELCTPRGPPRRAMWTAVLTLFSLLITGN